MKSNLNPSPTAVLNRMMQFDRPWGLHVFDFIEALQEADDND
jgi:hypothetical protein